MNWVWFLCLIAPSIFFVSCSLASPKHVHISLGNEPTEMNVMWLTENPSNTLVYYYPSFVENRSSGITIKGTSKPVAYGQEGQFIHSAVMTNLQRETKYSYRVGSEEGGWSPLYDFYSTPVASLSSSDDKVRIVAFGDMGVKWEESRRTPEQLTPRAKEHSVDLFLHVGDLAYAFGDFVKWNTWFDRVEALASRVPYMITPGNRDEDEILTERFRMPSNWDAKSGLYYSYSYLWVKVISLSLKDDFSKGSAQVDWLTTELQDASNRIKDPFDPLQWVMVVGHTPLYSSSDGHTHGNQELKKSIESLLYIYNVTLCLWGDDHVYERSYPVHDDQVDPLRGKPNRDQGNVPYFVSPAAPIHITAGTGGIELDGFDIDPPSWSAYREKSHGYVSLEITKYSMKVKFIQLNTQKVIDEFWILKPANSDRSFGRLMLFILPVVGVALYYSLRSKKALRAINK